jgi:hypothetical protein
MIKKKKIEGNLDLKGLMPLLEEEYEFLDISEAEMGVDEEKWEVCLGWSHSGPVYGNSGWRKVEVLKRLLEQINAQAIFLPDNVQRRHINAAKKNPHIKELQVSSNCPIFSYEDGKLMNKKKTKPVFGCQTYTVTGEIRGEWMTDTHTVDIILSNEEVKQIKKLVKESNTDNFLSILDDEMPKLYDFLYDHFVDLAWKKVVQDGMDYYNLSRKEAEEADMGDVSYYYYVFVPKEFK